MRRASFLLIAMLLALRPALAEPDRFELETTDFHILDKFDRPWVAAPNTVAVGVRLSRDAEVASVQAQGIEYSKTDDKFGRFPVTNGMASVRFVVFRDRDHNPLPYEVVLLRKSGTQWLQEPLRPHTWMAGAGGTRAVVHSASRAPQQTSESVAVGLFVVAALALIYLLFGQVAFRRLLFNRRLEVEAAEWRSNALVAAGVLLLAVAGIGVILFPQTLWGQPLAVHGVVAATFAALLLTAFGIVYALTRK